MRKSSATLPPEPLTQAELEDEHTKHIRIVKQAEPTRRGRIRNASHVPTGDVPTTDVVDIVSQSIQNNADVLEWQYGEGGNALTANQWATIIVRAIRYGVPTDEFEGDGFHIRDDDDPQDPPVCDDCQEDDNE